MTFNQLKIYFDCNWPALCNRGISWESTRNVGILSFDVTIIDDELLLKYFVQLENGPDDVQKP